MQVGIAPHSVRAVSLPWLRAAHAHARQGALPFHMHVAEQRRELAECLAEHGRRPVELLADEGIVDERFVGVHATHLSRSEAQALGRAGAFACLCRTTERDLGDGSPDVGELRRAGVRLCVGVDSHARSDALEELRAIELDERVRAEARLVAAQGTELLAMGSAEGYAAIGQDAAGDEIALDANDPSLLGLDGVGDSGDDGVLDDAVVFGADSRAVREVRVAGRALDLESPSEESAAYARTLRALLA